MIYSIDCNKGHKYLGMLFYPTNDLDTIILNNISKRKVNVAKYYAWLEINDNTPVDVKLLVLVNACLPLYYMVLKLGGTFPS